MATTVLGLKTFSASDPVDYNEINENYNKIDNGVKTALQGRAAHNLLDNSDFRNPVNQRGASSYTGAMYTIDRWRSWDSGFSMTISDGGIVFSGGMFTQYIGKSLNGIYTLAAMTSSGTLYMLTANMNDAMKYEGNLGMGSPSEGPQAVSIGAGTYIWAALYEGSYTADTLPAYVPKGYAAELVECMRYYYRSNDSNSGQDGMIIRRAINMSNSTKAYSLESVDLPIPMRIKPTITVFDIHGNKNYVQEWHSNNQVGNTSIRYANNRSFCVASESGDFIGGKSYYFNYEASADL